MAGGDGRKRPGSAGAVGKTQLTSGALLHREMRERRPTQEDVNRKGKRSSHEDATDAWAGWASRDDFSLRGQRDWWAGWARGQAGRGVGRTENQEK
jgi:hypothetical protein